LIRGIRWCRIGHDAPGLDENLAEKTQSRWTGRNARPNSHGEQSIVGDVGGMLKSFVATAAIDAVTTRVDARI
jgi:hypothetical protein